MATLGDVLGSLRTDSPWLLVLAVALLSAAGAVGRRVTGSIGRIGARVGELEAVARSERNRRRQVEAELVALGIRLPYWPEDPPVPASWRRRRPADDDEDQGDELPPATTEASYSPPPVPDRAGSRHGSR